MSTGLIRCHTTGHLHFLTFSCFRHRPILGTPHARDTFLHLLEQLRSTYNFDVIRYVVMSHSPTPAWRRHPPNWRSIAPSHSSGRHWKCVLPPDMVQT